MTQIAELPSTTAISPEEGVLDKNELEELLMTITGYPNTPTRSPNGNGLKAPSQPNGFSSEIPADEKMVTALLDAHPAEEARELLKEQNPKLYHQLYWAEIIDSCSTAHWFTQAEADEYKTRYAPDGTRIQHLFQAHELVSNLAPGKYAENKSQASQNYPIIILPSNATLDKFADYVIADCTAEEQVHWANAIPQAVPFWFDAQEAQRRIDTHAPLGQHIQAFKEMYGQTAPRIVSAARQHINETMGHYVPSPTLVKAAINNPLAVAEIMAYSIEVGLDRCFSDEQHTSATDFFLALIVEQWVTLGKPDDPSTAIRRAIGEFYTNRMDEYSKPANPQMTRQMHLGFSTYIDCLLDIKKVKGDSLPKNGQ